MQVKATVVFPLEVNIELPDGTSLDDVWQAILDQADKDRGDPAISPVIQSCSEDLLSIHPEPEKDDKEKELDSEEDWIIKINDSINQSSRLIKNILPATKALKEDKSILVGKLYQLSLLMDEVVSSL